MSKWTIDDASELYGVPYWGDKYFGINKDGHVTALPEGTKGPQLDLYNVTMELRQRGIRTPVLIRLADLTRSRVELLNSCFHKAMSEYDYKGSYQAVYPIKVNQQRHLIEELVEFGDQFNLGLECGSKPELLVVLSQIQNQDRIIICNGFKDTEYIETAVLASKLGKHTIIVVDRKEELPMILDAARKFDTKPRIGLRVKLASKAGGKWVDSAGDRSKFGLTTSELVEGFQLLESQDQLDCLELLHFHIGSQIPSIGKIKASLKEGARFYTELRKLGAPIKYLDVGGGLGIDYDGSKESDSSINYSEQEYANDVVSIIQNACEEMQVEQPTIVTENGRALVAHHSVLVFDVLGKNSLDRKNPPQVPSDEKHKMILELEEIYEELNKKNLNEFYHDTIHIKESALQLFTYGMLNIKQKALVDSLYWTILTKMHELSRGDEDLEDIHIELKEYLSDTLFCNFSVFQSLPDSWALDQLFPILPIHRLNEEPTRKAVLVDLTCDSDGKIDKFPDIETGKVKKTIDTHDFSEDEPYFMGVFLVGAYQETLGDLHNLFGDTDAVHVKMDDKGGYYVSDVISGDTVGEVLSYVQFNREELVRNMRKSCETGIAQGSVTRREAALLMKYYEEGLAGYTYLEKHDDEPSLSDFSK